MGVVNNPATPDGVLLWMAQSDPSMHHCIALNPNNPGHVLHLLVNTDDIQVRSLLACHNNTSADDLACLLNDPDPEVAILAMDNPNLRPQDLATWGLAMSAANDH